MAEQQPLSAEEEGELELEEAEKAFAENAEISEEAAADMQADMAIAENEESSIKKVDNTPSTKDILIALGFKRKEDSEPNKVQYTLTDGEILIGRTFTDQFKRGKFWAIKNSTFLLDEELKELPIVKRFYAIRNGKEPISETAVTGEETTKAKHEVSKERNQQILVALGFRVYHDPGVTKYVEVIKDANTKIGVTFNETNPLGKVWAYTIPGENEEKTFLKNGDLSNLPLIQKYHAIQEGKEPLPEITVTGKVIEKRGKAVKIEIEENGETKEIFFGQGAVKKDATGYFIPAGFSKAAKGHEGKMVIPRDIRLPEYLAQLKQAPAVDTEKVTPETKDAAADIVPHTESTIPAEDVKSVDYYVQLLGEITEKVQAEERIAERERGYAINMVFNAVTRDARSALIAELKNGEK